MIALFALALAAGCSDDGASPDGADTAGSAAGVSGSTAGNTPDASTADAAAGAGGMGGAAAGADAAAAGAGDLDLDDRGTFTDPRDGQSYPWVRVGAQVWFTRDLDFSPTGDRVADEQAGASKRVRIVWSSDTPEEQKFELGTHYQWAAAMGADLELAMERSATRREVRGICPEGWRMPSLADWHALADTLDALAGPFAYENSRWDGMAQVVKTAHGWADNPGTDDFGLAFLPTGYMTAPGDLVNFTRASDHWASVLDAEGIPYFLSLSSESQTFALIAFRQDYRCVRCLLDR